MVNIAWWPLPAVLSCNSLFFFLHCFLVCPESLFEWKVSVIVGSLWFKTPFLYLEQICLRICEKVINLNHMQWWKSICPTANVSPSFGGVPFCRDWGMTLCHTHPRNCLLLSFGAPQGPPLQPVLPLLWAYLHHFHLVYAGNQAGFPKLLVRHHCCSKWNLFFFAF